MDKIKHHNESKNFKIHRINRIKINLATPTTIKFWGSRTTITSYNIKSGSIIKQYSFITTMFGEVTTGEISFTKRSTERFTKKGLFSEEIFGPINSFKCYCDNPVAVFKECPECGITHTFSKVRGYRFGYIPLIFPVFNSLIFLGSSSIVKLLFDLPQEKFIDFIYFTFPTRSYKDIMTKAEKAFNALENVYDFIDTVHTGVQYRKRLVKKSQKNLEEVFVGFDKYLKAHVMLLNKTTNYSKDTYTLFNEIFYNFLDCFDLKKEIHFIISTILYKGNKENHNKTLSKKLRIYENFYKTNTPLSTLMFKTIPVIPPQYRPFDADDPDASQSSIFNQIYQYILQVNDKLTKIVDSKLVKKEHLLITEVRSLQEAVDFLVDHSKIKKNNLISERPSKSFADIIKGKTGRFRKDILGKRINFSARSVIVVNPLLKMNQCGIPLNILLNILMPKINNILDKLKITYDYDFKTNEYLYFSVLKNIIRNEIVLLNRAPTLHKLGLQTFNIILTNSDAIQLHPLVCSAYNADFDGDQMAVYFPLTKLSYIEFNSVLKTTKELFLFGNSNLKMKPSQELILGLNYLSVGNELIKNFSFGNYFTNYDDFFSCLMHKRLNIHSILWVNNKLSHLIKNNSDVNVKNNYIRSTVGRVLINNILNKIV